MMFCELTKKDYERNAILLIIGICRIDFFCGLGWAPVHFRMEIPYIISEFERFSDVLFVIIC
jgi:hypothetical protein